MLHLLCDSVELWSLFHFQCEVKFLLCILCWQTGLNLLVFLG